MVCTQSLTEWDRLPFAVGFGVFDGFTTSTGPEVARGRRSGSRLVRWAQLNALRFPDAFTVGTGSGGGRWSGS